MRMEHVISTQVDIIQSIQLDKHKVPDPISTQIDIV